MIEIETTALDAMHAHAVEGFPEEVALRACGSVRYRFETCSRVAACSCNARVKYGCACPTAQTAMPARKSR